MALDVGEYNEPALPEAVLWGVRNFPSGVNTSLTKRSPTVLSFDSTSEKSKMMSSLMSDDIEIAGHCVETRAVAIPAL
jgi:hypothetical protein